MTTDTTTTLDLDRDLPEFRLPEVLVDICLRLDLRADLRAVATDLGPLIDRHGHPLDPDNAGRVEELTSRAEAIRAQVRTETRWLRLRALTANDFDDFMATHGETEGSGFTDALIARVAITPELTAEEVAQLRGKLDAVQWLKVANTAVTLCPEG